MKTPISGTYSNMMCMVKDSDCIGRTGEMEANVEDFKQDPQENDIEDISDD